MASGLFGTPISEETVRATGEYKEPITQKDVADYAMKMINAGGKDLDAQKFVDNLKDRYGNGISARCLIYNATGKTLSLQTYKDWSGHIYDAPYPSDIHNGQWGAFLHVHPAASLVGSFGAVVYRSTGVCDLMFGWGIPYIGDNGVHTEPKCKLFAWLAIHGKLLTADNLATRGWDHDPICALCLSANDTINHLLKDCQFTAAVWSLVQSRDNNGGAALGLEMPSVSDWWDSLIADHPAKEKRRISGRLLYVLWNAWKERNRRIFSGKRLTYVEVAELAEEDIRQRARAFASGGEAIPAEPD